MLEVVGELGGGVLAEHRDCGEEIGDLADVRERDGVDLGVVASEPAGGRALVVPLVLAQHEAQGEGVLECDPLELPG